MAKKNPIHGVGKTKFWERKWVIELVSVGPPFLVAVAAVVREYSVDVDLGLVFWLAVGACMWLLAASVLKVLHAKRQDAKEEAHRNHEGLRAALHVLHRVVTHCGGIPEDEAERSLRVTFHRVVPPLEKAEEIEQIVPYVGGRGDGEGRKFPIRAGITGKAIREDAVFVMSRRSESYEDYKKELVSDWHYTDNDVKNVTSDRFSAIAIPVRALNKRDVLGVIYLDSNKKDFFTSSELQAAVVNACSGIVNYVGERYV